jgi:hypothetical protein
MQDNDQTMSALSDYDCIQWQAEAVHLEGKTTKNCSVFNIK